MFVHIKEGQHRGSFVSGTFPVVKPFNGKTITVTTDGNAPFQCIEARVKVIDGGFHYSNREGEQVEESVALAHLEPTGTAGEPSNQAMITEYLATESDDDAMARIGHSFEMLDKVTDGAIQGIIKGLVVVGPPGVGKSFGVINKLQEATLFSGLQKGEPQYEIVKGVVSTIGLYQILWDNREPGRTVLFDDSDGILAEPDSLNMLKAALDSCDKRILSYRKESRVLEDRGIDNSFEFQGSIIFLSNLNFDKDNGSKLNAHLEAIMSRCHYMDLEIDTQRDKLLRIKQIVRSGMLEEFNFPAGTEQMIVDYIVDNADYMRELSLRMVKKIADIVAMDPENWQEFTEATCQRRDAKYKRLIAERDAAA